MGLITKLATVVGLQKFRRRVVKSNLRQEKRDLRKVVRNTFFSCLKVRFFWNMQLQAYSCRIITKLEMIFYKKTQFSLLKVVTHFVKGRLFLGTDVNILGLLFVLLRVAGKLETILYPRKCHALLENS